MTMGLKKLGAAVAVTLFAIFAIWDTAHDFVANDTFCYFAHQPDRLLFVATIAIVGGFAALFFYWLSPRLQRRVKLLVLGLAAIFCSGYSVCPPSIFRLSGVTRLLLCLCS